MDEPWDAKKYLEMKDAYWQQLQNMRPAETCSQEMKEAFANAIEDMYYADE